MQLERQKTYLLKYDSIFVVNISRHERRIYAYKYNMSVCRYCYVFGYCLEFIVRECHTMIRKADMAIRLNPAATSSFAI